MENVTPKLYLNMILKDDEPVDIVQRGIDVLQELVDGMYITVTYSDTLPEASPLLDLLNQYGAEVSFFKWTDDFAEARNFALSKVPKGSHNYIYWQDADDVLQGAPNLRPIFLEADKLRWAGVFFVYLYRVDLDENDQVREIRVEQQRERIARNDGTYEWRGMLHETLIGKREENFQQHLRDECTVLHLSTEERVDKALERNIRILEKQLQKEAHHDPRTLVYLAKGYYDKAMAVYTELQADEKKAMAAREEWFKKALVLFDEYINGKGEIGDDNYIEESGWHEERASAWQYISQIFLILGEFEQSLEAINSAIEEAERFPQYYIDKAVILTHLGQFKKARHWLTVGTNIEIPKTTLMLSPRDMKVRALECDAHISMEENRLKQVSQDYERLLEIDPGNKVYLENKLIADSLNAANQAGQSIVFLGKYLTKIGEEDKILPLLQSVPNDLQKEPFYAQMRHRHIPSRMWEKDEIAILCGPGFEPWTPKSIEKGIGGSEEAVIYLAKELAQLGWKVTVFANPGADEGDFDGVRYENYYKLNPMDLFNHLVLWRGIGFTDVKPKVQGQIILWMHDMPNIHDFTPERLEYVDKIAVLSQFHREQMKMVQGEEFVAIPDEKFFLTRNGIPDLGITTWKGNPHRLCYVSSPDRGLIYLLKAWADIRTAVPDAELHIYYGFDVYDFIHRDNPAKMAFKKKILDLMKQEGVTYHSRVGHQELAEEMNKCGVWAYPTDFTEISCISGMKAQATGAVPVVTNFAALKETVRNGYKVDVDIQEKEGRKVYFDLLIDVLTHPEKQAEMRNMAWAQEYFAWSTVAKQWDALLSGEAEKFVQKIMTPEEWQKSLSKSS